MNCLQPVLQPKMRSARALAFAVALLLLILPACGGAPTPLVATITSPDATAALNVGQAVNIAGKVTGGGLKSVDVFIDGTKYATVDTPAQNNEFVLSAPWTPTKAGAHVIQIKGNNDKGEVIVASDVLFVSVQGSPATATPQPPPATAATPTTAPTTAAAAPTTAAVAVTPTQATASGPTVSVKEGDFVNVRKGPAVAYDKLGTLDKGQSALIRGKSSDGAWWQINFPTAPDGVGWVFGQLVNVAGDTSGVTVAQAPALPTAPATQATAQAPTAAPAATATSSVPPSSLLPYSQAVHFSPRDNIGDVPLGYSGEGKTTTLVWEINGAKSLELEITAVAGSGIFQNCAAGNLSTVSPNDAAGKRKPLPIPSGSYQVTVDGKGYYLFTLYATKLDGSVTTIPRNVIVDCYKTQ